MNNLVCIITGPEHNGTTYLKNILDSHPNIFSGFETGLLLNHDFSKTIPFKDWIFHNGFHWGLSKDINLFDKSLSIKDKYKLLLDNKGSGDCNIQNKIKKSSYIVDKTPAYFRKLSQVYKILDCKDIPILITIKYYKECYISYVVKRKMSIEIFNEKINNWMNSMIWFKNNKKELKNIYLFRYKDIIKPEFIKKLKIIIADRINVNYEMSYDNYIEKLSEMEAEKQPLSNWKSQENIHDKLCIPEKLKEIEIRYNNLIDELKEIV